MFAPNDLMIGAAAEAGLDAGPTFGGAGCDGMCEEISRFAASGWVIDQVLFAWLRALPWPWTRTRSVS